MARPAKPGLIFYRMEAGHILNKKVRLLVNEFGGEGYYIWSCLVDYAYSNNGYYFDSRDKEAFELFCLDYCKCKPGLVNEVINGCLRRGLFDESVAQVSGGILTSQYMQDMYILATAERRKKGAICTMQEEWLLIDFKDESGNNSIIPGNLVIIPGNNGVIPGRKYTEYSRVEESKEEKSIEKVKQNTVSAPEIPAQAPKNGKRGVKKPIAKEEEPPEPHWSLLVKAFFNFYKSKFNGEDPTFDGKVPKDFKEKIVIRLKTRAIRKNIDWSAENAMKSLSFFLESAYQDEWLSKHFTVENLCKQFDVVIQRQVQAVNSGKVKRPPVSVDVQYLMDRFMEGKLDRRLIEAKHFDELVIQGAKITQAIVSRRIKQLEGTSNYSEGQLCLDYQKGDNTAAVEKDLDNLKRLAVLEFFEATKNELQGNHA